MGVFDQAARFATMVGHGFVLIRLRPQTGLVLGFRRWFNVKGVPLPDGPDREADLVAVADEADASKPAWLLIFEVQSQHDEDKPKVLLLEASIFLCHARDTDHEGGPFQPLPVFVYLKGKCPASAVSVRTPTGRGFECEPAVWEVGEDSAADTLAKVQAEDFSWEALFWVSLMSGADREDVVALWQRLRDEKVPPKRRADVTTVALIFANLVGRRPAWNRVLGGVKMTESDFVNELVEEFRLSDFREALLRVIRGRFPQAVTTDVERTIADQPSLALLREWLDAAGTARTAEDFLAALRR
jgi:hypothetical protein